MQVQTYLIFNGRAEEAIAFYRKILGAEVSMLMRMKENPEPAPPGMLPPGWEDKVMHAEIRVGETTLMISDGHQTEKPSFEGFSLTLIADDDRQAERWFEALANGGNVTQPLITTFFSSRFGMLTDHIGVPWTIIVADASASR
jgi:PhnB protein